MDGSTLGAAIALIKKNKPTDEQIESAVSDWLDDHPEATTTVQDGSITKAKLDENLQGTVDDVSDLKNAINDATGAPMIEPTYRNKRIMIPSVGSGNTVAMENSVPIPDSGTSSTRNCYIVSCVIGDIFTVTGKKVSSSGYRLWAFIDSEGNVLACAADDGTEVELEEIIAPDNAAWFLSNDHADYKYCLYKGRVVPKLSAIREAIGYNTVEMTGKYSTASYWNKESTEAEKKSAASYIAWNPIEITPGTKYTVSIYQGTSNKQDPIIIVDEQYNIIRTYRGTNSSINTFAVEVTDVTAKYALLTSFGNSSLSSTSMTYKTLNSIPELKTRVTDCETAVDIVTKSSVTTGKYVSILGDSISALAGTIPEGNEAYYTGSNYSITSEDDMWYKIVADTLGMNVLVNNSWSGSQVCDRTPGAKIPASYPARCQALHDESHDPDYVLIAMGVNDYSYNTYLGEWNGKTMPVDDVDFTQSYALMLNRIKSAYPNVKIICITPWFVQRGQDAGINYVNSQSAHLTESAYGGVIRKLCDMLGAIYIDSDVGFNRYNYYPTYCEDDEDTPTHPNKTGQAVMGKVIAEKIRSEIF